MGIGNYRNATAFAWECNTVSTKMLKLKPQPLGMTLTIGSLRGGSVLVGNINL